MLTLLVATALAAPELHHALLGELGGAGGGLGHQYELGVGNALHLRAGCGVLPLHFMGVGMLVLPNTGLSLSLPPRTPHHLELSVSASMSARAVPILFFEPMIG